MADSEALRHMVEGFGRVHKRRKMRVNESKSKALKCTRRMDDRRMNVALNGRLLD